MHFPTTSCDLSPVTGKTPGAGSASGGTKGRPGSGSPLLGGWDFGGCWLPGLVTGSETVPGQHEAAFPPVQAGATRIHPASWVFGSRSGGPNLWAPTMRVTGTAVGHISGIVEYDGKPPGSQKTQPLHFISGQTSPGGDVTPKHEISEPMLLAKLKHTAPLILTSLTASGELSPKCHLSISFPNYHPFQAGHSHKSLFFFFLALLPLILSFPLVR